MSIFTKKTVRSFSDKSNRIFKVFTQVQSECEKLNNEITGSVTDKQKQKSDLETEIEELLKIQQKNTNLSKKIETFLTT